MERAPGQASESPARAGRSRDAAPCRLQQWGKGSWRRQQRLCLALGFRHVRQHGGKLVGRYVVLSWAPAPDNTTRLGVIASRRYDRRAVGRNRARRVMREAFRLLHETIRPPSWVVLIARYRIQGATAADVQHDLRRLLRKAGLWDTP